MPRGGKRPGAGRKKQVVRDWQARNLELLKSVFDEASVREIAESLRDAMKAGDKDAWRALAYVFGAPPKEVTLQGDDDAPLKMVVEIAYVSAETNTD